MKKLLSIILLILFSFSVMGANIKQIDSKQINLNTYNKISSSPLTKHNITVTNILINKSFTRTKNKNNYIENGVSLIPDSKEKNPQKIKLKFEYENLKGFEKILSGRNKGKYDVIDSGYMLIPTIDCYLFNSSNDPYEMYPLKTTVTIKKNKLILEAEQTPDFRSAFRVECVDPLVNETTPIVMVISKDGTNIDSDLTDYLENNSVRNYTFITGSEDWSNLTSSTYDSRVDAYLPAGDLTNQVLDIGDNTRGMVILGTGREYWGGGLAEDGLGHPCEEEYSGSDGTFNLTSNAHYIFNHMSSGSVDLYDGVMDVFICEKNRLYVPRSQCYLSMGANMISGCILESGDLMNGTATNSRVVLLPHSTYTGSYRFQYFRSDYKLSIVKALNWTISALETGGSNNDGIVINSFYNSSTSNDTIVMSDSLSEAGRGTSILYTDSGCSVGASPVHNTTDSASHLYYHNNLVHNFSYYFKLNVTNGIKTNTSICKKVNTNDYTFTPSNNDGIEVSNFYNYSTSLNSIVFADVLSEAGRVTVTTYSNSGCTGTLATNHNTTDSASHYVYVNSLPENTTYYYKLNVTNGIKTNTSICLTVTTNANTTIIYHSYGLTYNPFLPVWFSRHETSSIIDEINGNNPSVSGCILTTGYINNGTDCPSGGSTFTIGRTPEFNLSDSFAVGSWIKYNAVGSRLTEESTNPASTLNWYIDLTSAGVIGLFDLSNNGYETNTNNYAGNEWHYLLVQTDNSSINITINGSAVSTTESGSFVGFTHTTGKYYAGHFPSMGSIIMDNMAYWNKTLTSDEIRTLATADGDPYNIGLTVKAYESYSGDSINNYSITIRNSTNISTVNTTTGTAWFNLDSGTYQFVLESNGFVNSTGNMTSPNLYNVPVFEGNSLQVYVFEEETGDLITEHLSLSLLGDNTSYSDETDTGNINITELIAGVYSAIISSDNYTTAYYTVTIESGSSQNLYAYLSNYTDTVIFTLLDALTGQVVEGASMSIETNINGSWTLISAKTSDISGKIQLNYNPDSTYKFIVSSDSYDTKTFTLSPILFSEYDVILTPTTTETDTSDYAGINLFFTPTIFYEQNRTNFTFTIYDPEGSLIQYGVNLTYPSNTNYSSGSNAYGDTFDLSIDIGDSSIGDTVDITYYYETSDSGYKEFTSKYYIITGVGNYTLISNRNYDYGMGSFDKALFGTLFLVLIMGATTLYAGAIAGGFIGMFIMGYFAYIGLWHLWAVLISMTVVFIIISWRSTQ